MPHGIGTWIAAIAVGCLGNAMALAQHEVSPISIDMDNWQFTAIVTPTGAAQTVNSFLALKDSGTVVGSNISAIWYVRDQVDPTTWTSKSWQTQDQWKIIEQIKDSLQIPDSFDDYWSVVEAPPLTPAAATEMPTDFYFGVLAADPMALVIQESADPVGLVAFLTDVGYASAAVPVSTFSVSNCPVDTVLNGMAAGVEAAMAGNLSSGEATSAMNTYLAAHCQLCLPSTTWTTGAWGPWSVPTAYGSCGTPGVCVGGSICHYCRTISRLRARSGTHTYLNCTTAICTQTQTQTQTEKHSCACQPAPCPATPIQTYCTTVNNNAPFARTSSSRTDWSPPCAW